MQINNVFHLHGPVTEKMIAGTTVMKPQAVQVWKNKTNIFINHAEVGDRKAIIFRIQNFNLTANLLKRKKIFDLNILSYYKMMLHEIL